MSTLAIVGFSVLGVLVLAGAWLGVRGVIAKDALESAQAMVDDVQELADTRDLAAIGPLADELVAKTSVAAEMTSDPVWRAAEFIPFLGKNLTVVRELAGAVNQLSVEAIVPLADIASGGLDSFKPSDGRFDTELYTRVADMVVQADGAMTEINTAVQAIDPSGTVGPVADATVKLQSLLGKAQTLLHQAGGIAEHLPALLGADGPRNYILLFQNNAESMSLGGGTSAWSIVNVDDGAIKITSQVNSNDFSRDLPIPMELPQELLNLYNPDYFRYATNVTLRPDFPTAGQLASAFWKRWSGSDIDGVIAIDPVALGYLLESTGPLPLAGGIEISSENAVSLLLSQAYQIFPDPLQQDAFFASAAGAVFDAMTSTSPDINRLIGALQRAIAENRFLVWSAHPEEQAAIATLPFSGILPTTNDNETEVGVFFVEHSASKMSYYLKTTAAVSTTICEPDQEPTFSVAATLHSDITPENYAALSWYVRSGVYFDPVMTRTLVFVYGPPGTEFQSWSWDGSGLGTELITTGFDLGRPVAQIRVSLAPGQTASISATFAAGSGQYGPLEARVTPMVNPTSVSVEAPGCAPGESISVAP